ncbi:MAG: metallophosphoesterase family protein [Clostridiales bacterium]|nr:metallophosphoesterase family protein [Clostridiales bacterium]
MKKIGLLSDTHSHWDDKYITHFNECDEIWHAGDIGSMEVAERFEAFKPFRAVYGNIDGQDLRQVYPENNRFTVEGVDVLMTHIGGYPGRYEPRIRSTLFANPPKIFISGHSHILKVMFDKKIQTLHMNPGAAGIYGFHQVRTLLRFVVDNGDIRDLEVIELGKR